MKKIFLSVILLFISTSLFAHKVNIFYYAENNTLYLETYFSDGTKCKNSDIAVFDKKTNKKIIEGKTDKEGKFSFKIPNNDDLKIVLNAEMGHRAEVVVKSSEWLENDNSSNGNEQSVSNKTNADISNVKHITGNYAECDYKKFEKILDKKLKPVLRELALLKADKPSFNEIFGGIGYIFGLFGIIFYFKAKK